MRVHVAADHAAYDLKEFLVKELTAAGYEVIDHGAHTYDAGDDYPVFVLPAAEAVAAEPASRGLVLGGSGNGEQIAANKVKGVRAGLAYNTVMARLAREHNDARILALGGRMQSLSDALAMATVFLETPFSGDPRHQRRIEMLEAYEEKTCPRATSPIGSPAA
jgi:ribose 5-phosphate isomerase B